MMKAAAGVLSERESASLERHLSACARCAAEMDDLRAASALFGSARTPVPEPPPDLASRVLDRIAAEAPAPPRRRFGIPLRRSGAYGGGLALGTAAAGIALVLIARNLTLDDQALMTAPPERPPVATAPAPAAPETLSKAPAPPAPPAPAHPVAVAQSGAPRKIASKPRVAPSRPRAKVAAGPGERATADGEKRVTERVARARVGEPSNNITRSTFFGVNERVASAPAPAAGRPAAAPGRALGDAAFDAASAPAAAVPGVNRLYKASPPASSDTGAVASVTSPGGELLKADALEAPDARTWWDASVSAGDEPADRHGASGAVLGGYRSVALARLTGDREARLRAEAVEDVYTSPDERAKTILSY